MNQSFWRAVGDLFAELVDAAVGGDFASILACEAPDDMRDLLERISDGRATALLAEAQTRLAMELPSTSIIEALPLPPAPPPAPIASPATLAAEQLAASVSKSTAEAVTDGAFEPTKAPVGRRTERIRFSTGAPAARGGTRVVQVTDESETTEIASRYEEQQGRFTINVKHIHGYAGPRCDLLSARPASTRDVALKTGSIQLAQVERFIEVKGRNQRTGAVELTENELAGAEKFGCLYFIYRVFCDPTDPEWRELAILVDPLSSPTKQISRSARFYLDDNSGADWFQLVRESADPA